ncbi:hypothetical protein LWI28_016249 [Acer negundo]|uniref:PORR domain-containing protein n=1 Tax=Acer negundo TaxID=4023 RepID=A0AAD5NTA8_ACENE|nr:hypothetical protein LWI28_016249 [Acer negundo]
MIVLKTLRRDYTLYQKTLFCQQRRWKKPVNSAQTRLEIRRTRDSKLDKLADNLRTLETILCVHKLMSTRKRGPFVSVQLMSRWRNILGLNINVGKFLHKYPHVFNVFTHPLHRNICCRLTPKFESLLNLEESVTRECELDCVCKIKKLLMMSKNGAIHVYALRLIRRELGLPDDFRDSILGKYGSDFRLVDLEVVEWVSREENESLGDATIETWREKEYREKWLSEFETKFAFPVNFPTGFRIERGFREKLKNWQRLPYIKPYERKKENVVRVRTCGGVERFEKRVIAIIHELLSLMVEKMVEVERLAHFRKDLGMEVNVRELLLKHPGIFYISTKGSTQTVFLRDTYSKGSLIEPNPIYSVRREMLNLVLLGRRSTRQLQQHDGIKEQSGNLVCNEDNRGTRDGDWVTPMLESFEDENLDDNFEEVCDSSEEEFDDCSLSPNRSTESETCIQGLIKLTT